MQLVLRKTLTLQASVEDRARRRRVLVRRDGDRVARSPRRLARRRLGGTAGGGAAVQLKGSSSQQLRLDPSQTTEIVFEMEAVALGVRSWSRG